MFVICNGHKTCLRRCVGKTRTELHEGKHIPHEVDYRMDNVCQHSIHSDGEWHACQIRRCDSQLHPIKQLKELSKKGYFLYTSGSHLFKCRRVEPIVCRVANPRAKADKVYLPVININLGTLLMMPDDTEVSVWDPPKSKIPF